MNAPVAVVLAGGFGTRLRHLLPDIPKPLAPVAGRPFLEWVLRYLSKQGFTCVVISTGHLAEKVDAFAANVQLPGLTLVCAHEAPPLGTAGGFLNALKASPVSTDTVLVCNGDSLVLAPLDALQKRLDELDADMVLLGLRMDDASRFGTLTVKDGMLVGFSEKQPGAGLINGGVYLFRRTTVETFSQNLPLSFEFDVFPTLLARGARIAVVECSAPFLDIGTEQTLGQADPFINTNMGWFS